MAMEPILAMETHLQQWLNGLMGGNPTMAFLRKK